MTSLIIFSTALGLYALLWVWYVGFGRKVSPALLTEVEQVMAGDDGGLTETHKKNIRHFLENDDGKDFVMVNLLAIKQPKRESLPLLDKYAKVFLGSLLKRAGHPIARASAAAGKIEFLNVPEAEEWDAALLVRYRSRRDFAEMIIETWGSEHHGFKLAALDRTFAFPASNWFVLGGPKLLLALVLALTACVLHILLS